MWYHTGIRQAGLALYTKTERIPSMTNILYDDATHTYTVADTGEKLRTVTEITSEICKVNKDFLEAFMQDAAEIGNNVHSLLAMYFDSEGERHLDSSLLELDNEEERKAKLLASKIKIPNTSRTEQIVYNEKSGYAGTADVTWMDDDGVTHILDWKTGSTSKKYCTIQLSLLAAAMQEEIGKDVEIVGHYVNEEGDHTPKLMSYEEVMALKEKLLVVEDKEVADNIRYFMGMMEDTRAAHFIYEDAKRRLKDLVLDQMNETKTTLFLTDTIKAIKVAGSERTTFDSTRFKKEKFETWKEYSKTSMSADSLRLTEFEEFEGED